MGKEYIEYEEVVDENYGKDSDGDIELLDEVEDIENAETENAEEENSFSYSDINGLLDYQLSISEPNRSAVEFKYSDDNNVYNTIVVGKSKIYTNRYVFKLLPNNDLKAFWTDKIILM